MEEDKKGKIDLLLEKVISRKFLTWVVATSLLLVHDLTSEHWMYISLCYIGSSACVDFVATLLRAKNSGGAA